MNFPTFRRLQKWIANLIWQAGPNVRSQSLLRMLALATEQRIPLPPLIRAFASDQFGSHRWRIERVADLIDGGNSLPSALEQVPHVLPREDVLAIRCGAQSGTLGPTLRSLVDSPDSRGRQLLHRIQGSMIYVAVVLFVCIMITTFIMVRIMPTYLQIFNDFGTRLPIATGFAISVFNAFANYWYVALLAACGLAWAIWSNWPGRSLRGGILGRLLRPWFDTRSVDLLQNLSVVTKAGRPIPGALSTLAKYHHDSSLRRKLLIVRNEVEQGANLWHSMQQVGLLSAAEVSVMESSSVVGNQPWAMEQLANRKRRRLFRRLEFLGELVSPAAIIVLGIVIFLVCCATFLPLVSLIQNLT